MLKEYQDNLHQLNKKGTYAGKTPISGQKKISKRWKIKKDPTGEVIDRKKMDRLKEELDSMFGDTLRG